ncbi:hypothetical protein [Pilimelia anulata]|nr:hypothetical protein [Pilimelia anulata]
MPAPPFPPPPPTMNLPPRPRGRGTMYGGTTGVNPRLPVFGNPAVENTGSLTGHILAHGKLDLPTPERQTRKVVIVGLSMLGAMIVIGLIVGLLAGNQVADLINAVISG